MSCHESRPTSGSRPSSSPRPSCSPRAPGRTATPSSSTSTSTRPPYGTGWTPSSSRTAGDRPPEGSRPGGSVPQSVSAQTGRSVVAGQVVTARIGTLWDNRRILSLLVTRDLKVKYADSVLGYLWSILEPLAMAGVYWFVFTKLMTRQVGADPYIVFLLCGMLPWQWTNAVFRSSMKSLTKDSKLVRSTNLPREIWVLRTVGSKFAEFVYALPVLAGFALLSHAQLHWQVVYVPLAIVLHTLLLTGAGLM